QNIPYKGEMASKIRSAFEAEKDNFLISLDYSQIELRLAAHLSSDPFLLEAFSQNKDIHKMTASYLFQVKEEEVTEKMRNQAKMLNYGILYGLGDKNLASYTGLTLEEAKKFKTEYFSKFFGLKNFLDYSLEKAKQLGYAETIFGRKRFLPLLGAYNQQGKEQERAALNMPIQGLAADLMKKTMIEINKYLKENQLEEGIKLIIQIHDELIFEGKKEIINKVKNRLIEIAENIHPLNVPLKVEAKIGKNLSEI
ncbi:MAG: DNA polymerase, partial [Minisyncoccia bacterium]